MMQHRRRALINAVLQRRPSTPLWSTGTDAEIVAFLQLADAGLIDLNDYWHIGDTRIVHLSAIPADPSLRTEAHVEQDVELVLMDNVCAGFEITGTGEKPHFIVGMKNGLIRAGSVYLDEDTTGGWRDCKRRPWCNNLFKSAIPSTLLPIFKQFTWSQGQGGFTEGVYETNDYFGITPEKAVFGRRIYSFPAEADLYTQWEWYETESNRIKTDGIAGTDFNWSLSSPRYGDIRYVCVVHNDGTPTYYNASSADAISPFGCI